MHPLFFFVKLWTFITIPNRIVFGKLQELLELAQRKFLRQVIQYADAMETSPFPRLFVLDFLSDNEKESLKATEQQPASQPADDAVDECPLAAAEAADAARADAASRAEVVLIFSLVILECEIIGDSGLICSFY